MARVVRYQGAIVELKWFDLASSDSWDALLTQDEITYPQLLEVQRLLAY